MIKEHFEIGSKLANMEELGKNNFSEISLMSLMQERSTDFLLHFSLIFWMKRLVVSRSRILFMPFSQKTIFFGGREIKDKKDILFHSCV